MRQIAHEKQQSIAMGFKWRDREGNKHRPDVMRSTHLANVVIMIWNHSMPEEACTHNYARYSFNNYYTPEYMRQAIRVMLPLALLRSDHKFYVKRRLQKMYQYLMEHDAVFCEQQRIENPKLLNAPKGVTGDVT